MVDDDVSCPNHCCLYCYRPLSQGEAVISDFQKSKILLGDAKDSNLLAQTYTRSGSSRFVAPELLKADAGPAQFESDVWAFGMTILQVLTGAEPYKPDGLRADYQVIAAVHDGITPRRPCGRNQWITDQVWQLMEECWRMDPEKRPDMKRVYDGLVTAEIAFASRDPIVR